MGTEGKGGNNTEYKEDWSRRQKNYEEKEKTPLTPKKTKWEQNQGPPCNGLFTTYQKKER